MEILDEGKKTFLLIENAYKNNNQSGFNAIINSDYLKNPIVINNKNNISFNGNKIEIENLNIEMGDSVLKLSDF